MFFDVYFYDYCLCGTSLSKRYILHERVQQTEVGSRKIYRRQLILESIIDYIDNYSRFYSARWTQNINRDYHLDGEKTGKK